MKRVCCFLLTLSSVFALSGCMGGNSSSGNGEGLKLTYNKKYVYREDLYTIEARQEYYIFYEDGTAKYHDYNDHGAYGVDAYTIYFKYEIVEEENMIFCFYNGFAYDETDTEHDSVSKTTIHELMYTENILMNTGGVVYMTEDFARDIPNFG